jgi:putative phosphoesterase
LRIVVISDIHSNLDALESVLASLPDYDELFCLGDLVGYGPQPNEVVERIRQLRPAAVLMGNHDYAVVTGDTADFSVYAAEAIEWTRNRIEVTSREYLASLELSANRKIADARLGLFHGSPRDPLTEYVFPSISSASARELIENSGAGILLLGHTHVPMLYSFGREILGNPGSVGQPRDGDPRASYAALTISEGIPAFDVRRVEYDIDAAARKIVRAGLPRFLAGRLYTGL